MIKHQPKRRQQIERERQNYIANPKHPICGNCEHYRSEFIESPWGNMEEKKRRCGIGEFATKRMGTCKAHAFHEDS